MLADEVDSLSSALLDYRFGWRWLLPDLTGNRVVSHGLCEDERQWWMRTQSLTLVSNQAEKFDGYLIALDSVDPDTIANQMNSATPRWLCAWGTGASVSCLRSSLQEFSMVREYALLPAGKPRVVVPLSSPENAVAGLRLHRPGRWLARIGLLIACGFARLKHYGLLRRNTLLIATREKEAVPQGVVQSDMYASILSSCTDYVLYLGTPDDNRKTIILPLGGMHQIILKQGELPRAQTALRKEADALQSLSLTPLAAQVPVLHNVVEREGLVVLHQEYRTRQWITDAGMRRAAIAFLSELSKQGRCAKPLVDVLNQSNLMSVSEARTARKMSYARIRNHLDLLAAGGAMIWGHRSHGDFAPWNCAWTAKGFWVYDWEDSQPWSVALEDAFYFAIAPALHISNKPNPIGTLNNAYSFATHVMQSGNLEGVDIKVHFALWSLAKYETHEFLSDLLDILITGENI